MNARVASAFAGRIIALLLLVKAVDATLLALRLVRLENLYGHGSAWDVFIDAFSAGFPVMIYSFLALTLWGRPQLLIPTDALRNTGDPPASGADWIRIAIRLIGVVLIANSCTDLLGLLFGVRNGYTWLTLYRPWQISLAQLIVGCVMVVPPSRLAAHLKLRSIRERMFPEKTDFFSQLSPEEQAELRGEAKAPN